MAGRPKYIQDKSGKFAGSIGVGKNTTPTSVPTPAPALLHKLQETASKQRHPAFAGQPGIDYDPGLEASRVEAAMRPVRGFAERRKQNQLRKDLETKFGPIDWSTTLSLV